MKPNGRHIWLSLAEGIFLYIGMPLLVFLDVIPLPKILILLIVTGYCGIRYWGESEVGRGLMARSREKEISKGILLRSVGVAISIAVLTLVVQPQYFLAFPVERPATWMVIMILYPLLSALPQEFIFRTYFFHHFEHLLPYKYLTVILSALAFAFLHIVYDNWWAVGLSFIGGLIFSYTYKKTRSLFWVTVEHAIYGCLLFTLGMGNYFYEGL